MPSGGRPHNACGAGCHEPQSNWPEGIAVQGIARIVSLNPEMSFRNSDIGLEVAYGGDDIALEGYDTLQDLLFGIFWGDEAHNVSAIYLEMSNTPARQEDIICVRLARIKCWLH